MKKPIAIIGLLIVFLLLAPFGYLLGELMLHEYRETKTMRYLKNIFEKSDDVERYSIVRVHKDSARASVWLKSGSYFVSGLNNAFNDRNVWYGSQLGRYSWECDTGGFEFFTATEYLTGTPVQSWDVFLEEVHNLETALKNYHKQNQTIEFAVAGPNGNKKVSKCLLMDGYVIPTLPAENEWKVKGRW